MAVMTHSSSAVRGNPARIVVQTTLAKELPGLENPDDRLLALLGQHDNFHPAFLDVEDRVRRVALRKYDLVLVESGHRLSLAYLREEGLRVKIAKRGVFQGSLHLNNLSLRHQRLKPVSG
jgi:hypothetical protein